MALYCVAFNPTIDKTLDNSLIIGIYGTNIENVIQQFVNLSIQPPKELMSAVRSFLIPMIEHIYRELNPAIGDWFYDCCELYNIRCNHDATSALKAIKLDFIKNNILKLMSNDTECDDMVVETHFKEQQANYALILSLAYEVTFVKENFEAYPLRIFGQTITKSAKKS